MGFGLVAGFIGHLKLVTTINYNRFTNRNLEFTITRAKSSMSSLVIAMQWLSTVGTPPPWRPCFCQGATVSQPQTPAPWECSQSHVKSQSYFTTGGLWPISLSWHQAPWGSPQLNPCGHSLYVTSSLTRKWVCLLWTCLAFLSSVSHIQHAIENSSLCTIYKSPVSPGFVMQIMPILCILCYNGTWLAVSLTTAKFKSLILSMSGFALSYTMNMSILLILYDFCLLPAQFYYIILYIGKVKSRV
jgi:hypothetical protein